MANLDEYLFVYIPTFDDGYVKNQYEQLIKYFKLGYEIMDKTIIPNNHRNTIVVYILKLKNFNETIIS